MASKVIYENPYERLAHAIVMQAVYDYRHYLKVIKKDPKNEDAVYEVKRIENFFLGGWFQALAGIEGEFLIRRLREEFKGK